MRCLIFCVAIYDSTVGDPDGPAALAKVLGCTAYEARMRLTVAGPCVVASLPDRAQSEALRARLRDAGFSVLIRSLEKVEQPEAWFHVRSFAISAGGIVCTNRAGENVPLPWSDVDALVRGMQLASWSNTDVVESKKFSMGRAALTGGLASRKKVKKEVVTRGVEREGFLHVYTRGRPICVFAETQVDYSGLGDPPPGGRAVSFVQLIALLQERTTARYDQRLLRRVAQKQVLGPKLDEETNIWLCSALVVGALLVADSA